MNWNDSAYEKDGNWIGQLKAFTEAMEVKYARVSAKIPCYRNHHVLVPVNSVARAV